MTIGDLEQFHASLLVVALVIHVVIVSGHRPHLRRADADASGGPRPIAWGGLFMPILWTGVSYVGMHVVNPVLPGKVSWPWFMLSQFVFGITMPAVVLGAKPLPPTRCSLEWRAGWSAAQRWLCRQSYGQGRAATAFGIRSTCWLG